MKCDILSLELYSKGRDIDIVEPVLSCLEIKYGLRIIRESIYSFEYKIIKYRPSIIIISNSIGSDYKVNAVKYASLLGIKVVTFISEGGYSLYSHNVEIEEDTFWGLNSEHKLYEDLNFQWNKNDYLLASKFLSRSDLKKLVVSGAVQFDKFKFINNDKLSLLNKYNKNKYDKVVLITTWSFSLLHGEFYKRNKAALNNYLGGAEYVEFHCRACDMLRCIYEKLILENKDILFIVKQHPNELDADKLAINQSEYAGLECYDNVLFIKGYQESIQSLIQVSDLLISYESTTGLEAWLASKPVFFINPLGDDFPRLIFYKGVAVAKTYEKAQQYIEEFYNTGGINDFNKKREERKKINERLMQWDDGKNHIRAALSIIELLNKPCKKARLKCFVFRILVRGFIKLVTNYKSDMDTFDYEERENEHILFKYNLKKFYKKYGDYI